MRRRSFLKGGLVLSAAYPYTVSSSMTTYNTGNPIGSESPKDLYDNAQNLDILLNHPTKTEFQDRLGVPRKTWHGMEQDFQQFLANSGYTGTGAGGAYEDYDADGPLTIDALNEIFIKDGEFYRLKPDQAMPYTTTTWATDEVNMVAVGDAALRQELSGSSGAQMVGEASGGDVQGRLNDLAAEGEAVADRVTELETQELSQYGTCADLANVLADGGTFTVDCYGDSTMWGAIPFETTSQDTKNPPESLREALAVLFPSNTPTVRNKAISGTTLEKLLAGTDGGAGTFEDRVSSSDAAVVYCNHCLNDCNSYQSDASEYRANLISFVRICRKYGKIPVIVTPTIINLSYDGQEFQMKRMPAFIQAQRDVAEVLSVDLVDNYLFSSKSSRLFKPETITPDGIHCSQLFNQMAGRNMAIPLVRPNSIAEVGDIAGLSTTIYSDSITNARGVFEPGVSPDVSASRFSSMLSGDSASSNQAINLPIIMEVPTDDAVLTYGGLQGEAGGKAQVTHFGTQVSPYFSGDIDFKREAGTFDYDYLSLPETQKLPAGFHIIGLYTNNALNGGGSANFNFAGVQFIKRAEMFTGNQDGDFIENITPILTGMKVRFSMYIGGDGDFFTLIPRKEKGANVVALNWSGGTITLHAMGVSVQVASGSQPGWYSVTVSLNRNRTVTANIGAATATTPVMSAALPTMYVGSQIPYTVVAA